MGLSLLVTALGLLLVQQPGNAALPALPPPMGRIDHFVVLLMENRYAASCSEATPLPIMTFDARIPRPCLQTIRSLFWMHGSSWC
jgi:hypothetical protein